MVPSAFATRFSRAASPPRSAGARGVMSGRPAGSSPRESRPDDIFEDRQASAGKGAAERADRVGWIRRGRDEGDGRDTGDRDAAQTGGGRRRDAAERPHGG